MSLSYVPLTPVSVEIPQEKLNYTTDYAVLQSPQQISFKQFSTNNISNAGLSFTCPPPSGAIIVDRNQLLQVPIRLTMTGAITTNNGSFTPSSTLISAGQDAPRYDPLSSAMDSMSATINNARIQIDIGDLLHPLSRYNECAAFKSRDFSLFPCMLDQSQNYIDLLGTNRNPLANFGSDIEQTVPHRGAFPFTVVSNLAVTPSTGGVSATSIVDMVVTTNLKLPPFAWGKRDKQGFYNVNSMDFNFNFYANAGFRMWSHVNQCPTSSGANIVTSTITSCVASFNNFSPAFSYYQSTPQLLFRYFTPNLLNNQRLGPLTSLTYPYSSYIRFPTDFPAITYASGPTTITSNNVQLSVIPQAMWVLARPTNQTLQSRCDISDTYLQIRQVALQWQNESTILSNGNIQQLYKAMNVENGSIQSWSEWGGNGLYGSAFPDTAAPTTSSFISPPNGPLMLVFGKDIQMPSNQAPGLKGQFNIQVNATVVNTNSSTAWDTLPMTLWLIFKMDGSFVITALGSSQPMLGVLSDIDVLNARQQPSSAMEETGTGGDFFSSIGSFFNKANSFLKDSKLVSTLAPLIPGVGSIVAPIASSLGYGVIQGGCDGGSVIQGGKRLTKAELRRGLSSR